MRNRTALSQAEELVKEILVSDTLTPYVRSRVMGLEDLLDDIRHEGWIVGYDEGLADGESNGW